MFAAIRRIGNVSGEAPSAQRMAILMKTEMDFPLSKPVSEMMVVATVVKVTTHK